MLCIAMVSGVSQFFVSVCLLVIYFWQGVVTVVMHSCILFLSLLKPNTAQLQPYVLIAFHLTTFRHFCGHFHDVYH